MHEPKLLPGIIILFLLTTGSTQTVRCNDDRQSANRNYRTDDLDEGSCVCGMSKEVLERLESIVHEANKQECSLVSNFNQAGKSTDETPAGSTTTSSDGNQNVVVSSQTTSRPNQHDESTVVVIEAPIEEKTPAQTQSSQNNSDSSTSDLMSQIHALQAQLASLRPSSSTNQQGMAPSNVGASAIQTTATNAQNSNGSQTGSSTPPVSSWIQPSAVITSQTVSQQSSSNVVDPQSPTTNQQQGPQQQLKLPESSSFLQGLPPSSGQPNNQAQNQKLETNEVQQAVVTTVPNVVSNIFTNIQDFAIQTEKNPNNVVGSTPVVTQLTSIDGSSAQLNKNDTSAQITAQGEHLFLQWIEHQIQAYHMTASMASYIRKSALNLFRRIVKQYVQRIERVGGAVESNVRQATQLALNNTQTLISFLLRNYLNFAGGLMQIIGEQVSRVGKQLDSTGDTIAHINLNPFDIVSNVIDSLPNPSRYSEYFRAFGKYLMGELTNSQSDNNDQTQTITQQDQQEETSGNKKRKGLFSKTMGALGKTLSSWIG